MDKRYRIMGKRYYDNEEEQGSNEYMNKRYRIIGKNYKGKRIDQANGINKRYRIGYFYG
jgi:hypothetical protein